MRAAAIGIGSNSLRMLIADIEQGHLKRLGRYREGMRVFAALDENQCISQEMIQRACCCVADFQKEAMAQQAEQIHLFATSAVRDAANQAQLTEALAKATGLQMDICSGDREAHLSFWGVAGSEETGVIDIGGGSTEIVIGQKRDVYVSNSLQMGAVRLYREMPMASEADAERVAAFAGELLRPMLGQYQCHHPSLWVGVGGTFTTIAALVQQQPWEQRQNIHGYPLTQQAVEQALFQLAPMPLEERLRLPWIQPQRADIVAHGFAILLACMRQLDIAEIKVSEYGNLEGYLKEKYLF